jgi:phage shock protein PspC (stress-responsive transcriptional regulator)
MTLSEELGKLAQLRASGSLTEEEFTRAKERLLQADPTQAGPTQAGPSQPNDPLVSAVNAFRRSRSDRLFGGVCGGMARSTGMAAWIWRLIFAALFIFAGAGLLLYLLLWIFVPSE